MSVETLLNQVPFQNRKKVKDDVTRLMQNVKTLLPKVGSLMSNTGVESKVLIMHGTIPIYYQSNQYNIPVELFITVKYPTEAPKIYVRPTPNMTIKQNHRHVDLQGLVFLPYLHEWRAESNLASLVEVTCSVFSVEPPLFSKPPTAAPSPILQAYANSNVSNSASPITATATPAPAVLTAYPSRPSMTSNPSYATATPVFPSSSNMSSNGNITYATSANLVNPTSSIAAIGGPAHPPATFSPYGAISALPAPSTSANTSYANHQPVTTHPTHAVTTTPTIAATAAPITPYNSNPFGITSNSTAQATASIAAEAQKAKDKRAKLIADVTKRMREELHNQQEILRDEMDTEFNTEKYLAESNTKAQVCLHDLQERINKYEEAIKLIAAKDVELSTWADEQKDKPVIDAETRLEPFDDLAAQVVKLNGELNAIDDAFYYLERALVQQSNKSVDLPTFLKENRRLARQQFMCKATLMKINATHMQQHAMANQTQQAQTRQANAVPPIATPQFYPAPAAPNGNYSQPYSPSHPYGQPPVTQQPTQQWPNVPTATVVPPVAASGNHGRNRAKLTIL